MAEPNSYPTTGTVFDNAGATAGTGTTRTGLSTQIIIYCNNEPVGAIQSFQETQARQNKKLAEVGTDGWIEIVPQGPATVSLSVSRIVFDGLSLPEAFSRGYKNIHAQRIPFDIVVMDKFAGDDLGKIVTTYHNCWFNNLSKTYQVNDYTITESAQVDCEFVSCKRNGQPVVQSQGVGGGRQVNAQTEGSAPNYDYGIEQAADMGDRRGVLDFPGLISAAY
jgi:hypothetical protein